jgi:hypothetical protein
VEEVAMKWLGVPRWVYLAVVLAALAGYVVFGRPGAAPPQYTEQARTAVEGLRTTSVYEEPGGPGIIDAERARALIGDRAIVLVLFATPVLEDPTHFTEPREERCAEIAELVATSIVIMYAYDREGEYEAEYCAGPQFANDSNELDAEVFTVPAVGAVHLGTRFRVTGTDKFAEVEEYVYAFDHYATRDDPDGIPLRGVYVPPPPVPDALQTWQVVVSLLGILGATLALFVLLRGAVGLAGRREVRTAANRTRAAAIDTRLNRLADTVLHPDRPKNARAARTQADLAGRYVLVMHRLGEARTTNDLAEVEKELTELENAAR